MQSTYGEPSAIGVVLTAADGRQYVHTTRLRDLEIETASPGGELSATWKVDAAEPYQDVLADPPAEVELFDRAGRFRHLRLEHPSGDFWYREASLAFEARGFSSHAGDDRFTHAQVYPAGTPIEQAFRHARDELCPLLSTSNAFVQATGAALSADSEDFGGKSAKAVFNALAALSGVSWHIWSQDVGRPYLEVVRPSAVADYVVRLPDQAAAQVGWDLQNLYNRVLVKWSGGYAWADDAESRRTFGVRRCYFVDRSQDLTDEGSAYAVAQSLLGNFGALPVDGFGVSLDYGVPLWDAEGAQVPLWRAKAGRTYELQGLVLGSEVLTTTFVAQQTIFSGEALTIVPIPQDALTDLALGTTRGSQSSGSGSGSVVAGGGGGSTGGGGGTGTTTNTDPDAVHEADFDAQGDLLAGTGSGTFAAVPVGANGSALVARSGATPGVAWEAQRFTIPFIIDGGGAAITTGVKGDVEIPMAGVIVAVRLLADQTGSIVIDLWRDSYASYPPTVANTITASAKPTLSAASKSENTTLTGWTTAVSAGDVLRFNVDSAATVQRVLCSLTLARA